MDQLRFLAIAACCAALGACDESPARTATHSGDLDISRYRETFVENFDRLDISAWGPGTRWIAHTPWAGDFGDAQFSDPLPNFPFATASTILRIEARKEASGKWRSGLISSRDHDGLGGSGFAQQYGYFEIETKLPKGPGVWPAFWLVGVTKQPRAEIDAFEYYGNAPDSYHANVHVWADDDRKFGDGKIIQIPPGSATEAFNRYGVAIDQDRVTFYFNRKEVWRTPTRPEYRQPMYMLANLALGAGWPIDKVPNPSFMYIKSITAYRKISSADPS